MPSLSEITVQQLCRLIGLPDAPRIVDVREAAAIPSTPRILPTARSLDVRDIRSWGPPYRGARVVVYCGDGGTLSRGAAAWLRDDGAHAETLSGGLSAWAEADQPLVRTEHIPARDDRGRTTWVTRQRPKIVRVACPWLIRRFIDPSARFLFVTPAELPAVAERFKATPFDTGHGLWNDRGELCTFDVMLDEFSLKTDPLDSLAAIIRGADTDRTRSGSGMCGTAGGIARLLSHVSRRHSPARCCDGAL